jgi:signal transduction histidine kinase
VNQLDCQQLDIANLVRDACDIFQSSAEDKGLTMVYNGPEHISLYGDIRLIQRMVANLLDNAIKYTPANGTIDVTLSSSSDQSVQLAIKDNGMGISGQDLERIFERFFRCDPSRSQAGTGLGLSFARAVVRAHNGNITVASTVGEGSAFTVILPKNAPV